MRHTLRNPKLAGKAPPTGILPATSTPTCCMQMPRNVSRILFVMNGAQALPPSAPAPEKGRRKERPKTFGAPSLPRCQPVAKTATAIITDFPPTLSVVRGRIREFESLKKPIIRMCWLPPSLLHTRNLLISVGLGLVYRHLRMLFSIS